MPESKSLETCLGVGSCQSGALFMGELNLLDKCHRKRWTIYALALLPLLAVAQL